LVGGSVVAPAAVVPNPAVSLIRITLTLPDLP
jgi:hypothetical protein